MVVAAPVPGGRGTSPGACPHRACATRAADELASLTVPVLKQRLRMLACPCRAGGARRPPRRAPPPARDDCCAAIDDAARADDGATRPGATYSILHADSAIVVGAGAGRALAGLGRRAQGGLPVARLRAEHALDAVARTGSTAPQAACRAARTPAAARAGMAFEARAVAQVPARALRRRRGGARRWTRDRQPAPAPGARRSEPAGRAWG